MADSWTAGLGKVKFTDTRFYKDKTRFEYENLNESVGSLDQECLRSVALQLIDRGEIGINEAWTRFLDRLVSGGYDMEAPNPDSFALGDSPDIDELYYTTPAREAVTEVVRSFNDYPGELANSLSVLEREDYKKIMDIATHFNSYVFVRSVLATGFEKRNLPEVKGKRNLKEQYIGSIGAKVRSEKRVVGYFCDAAKEYAMVWYQKNKPELFKNPYDTKE
jgi:hypothetical protein